VAVERLRSGIVREVPSGPTLHEPLTDWFFASRDVRQSSLLFLRNPYGDVVVVDQRPLTT
jgi:hypothetical protein